MPFRRGKPGCRSSVAKPGARSARGGRNRIAPHEGHPTTTRHPRFGVRHHRQVRQPRLLRDNVLLPPGHRREARGGMISAGTRFFHHDVVTSDEVLEHRADRMGAFVALPSVADIISSIIAPDRPSPASGATCGCRRGRAKPARGRSSRARSSGRSTTRPRQPAVPVRGSKSLRIAMVSSMRRVLRSEQCRVAFTVRVGVERVTGTISSGPIRRPRSGDTRSDRADDRACPARTRTQPAARDSRTNNRGGGCHRPGSAAPLPPDVVREAPVASGRDCCDAQAPRREIRGRDA